MNRKEQRATMANRIAFVGCQFCGRTDMPLRNYGKGKVCVECKKKVSILGTGKEGKYG